MDYVSLKESALALAPEQRTQLMAALAESLKEQCHIEAAWIAELKSRAQAYASGQMQSYAWKDVQAEMEALHRKLAKHPA